MLVYLFIKIVFCVILTELLTEIAVKSEIFRPIRKVIFSFGEWFKKLVSCGYCFSLWAAIGVVLLTNTSYPLVGNELADLGLMALVVHRLSNYLHNFNDCWLDKYYNTFRVNTDKSDG